MNKREQLLQQNALQNAEPIVVEHSEAVGGGIPDTYIVGDQGCFWVELKVTNGNKINVSPHQIAWHTSHSLKGGRSFILAKHLSSSILFLFEGSKVRELSTSGLKSGCMVQGSWNEIFDTLEHKI